MSEGLSYDLGLAGSLKDREPFREAVDLGVFDV